MSSRDDDIADYDAKEQSDGSWLHNDGDIFWYNEAGQIHREDGPSVIRNGYIHWYLNGDNYTFAEWLIKLNKPDEDKMLLRLRYA
jgi:hypothetical protein